MKLLLQRCILCKALTQLHQPEEAIAASYTKMLTRPKAYAQKCRKIQEIDF